MLPETEELIYRETVPLTRWVLVLVWLVLLVMIGIAVINLLSGVDSADRGGMLITTFVTIVIAFVIWNFRAIEIRVTRNQFEARYGIFNRTAIPLAEIETCLPTRASFGRYLGIGVRMGTDGTRAYTTSFGPAVEVRRRGARPFVVSTNNPSELCLAVDTARASGAS